MQIHVNPLAAGLANISPVAVTGHDGGESPNKNWTAGSPRSTTDGVDYSQRECDTPVLEEKQQAYPGNKSIPYQI